MMQTNFYMPQPQYIDGQQHPNSGMSQPQMNPDQYYAHTNGSQQQYAASGSQGPPLTTQQTNAAPYNPASNGQNHYEPTSKVADQMAGLHLQQPPQGMVYPQQQHHPGFQYPPQPQQAPHNLQQPQPQNMDRGSMGIATMSPPGPPTMSHGFMPQPPQMSGPGPMARPPGPPFMPTPGMGNMRPPGPGMPFVQPTPVRPGGFQEGSMASVGSGPTYQPGPPSAAPPPFASPMGATGMPRHPYPGGSGAAAPHHPSAGPLPPQRRLDPDLMPSAVQVQEDDRAKKSGLYNTIETDKAPPLVTTEFYSNDAGGNCSPGYMRCSTFHVPISSDLTKQLGVPFCVTSTPFAPRHEQENSILVSDMGADGPVRCVRCKAYMNPHMSFVDGGRRFICPLCGGSTEVPEEYFVHLDHTGYRIDTGTRPELCLGSYELVATAPYCKNDTMPNPPAYIFALDVSQAAVNNGLLRYFCAKLKTDILPHLPRDADNPTGPSPIRVGFLTYDRVIQFYNLKSCLRQPQIQVVSDVNDVFVPLVDGFLVSVEEAEQQLEAFVDMLQMLYTTTACTETLLAPAVQGAMEALKAANCAGKVFVFHCNLPTVEAPGRLKMRDDRGLVGTDKEKTLLTPGISHYTDLGQECVKVGCSVDLFLFPAGYTDVSTLAELPRLTGGNLHFYPRFHADLNGATFLHDLVNAVRSPCGFDAVIRLRTSTGTRPVMFYGNFSMSNTTDVDLACVDARTSLTFEVKHDDKLTEGDNVYLQLAVLYTTISGKRRLRIHNLRIKATANKMDVFRTADLDTLMNLYAKESVQLLLQGKSSHEVRSALAPKCAHILAAYRTNCGSNSNPGELVLPEQMKLMPLYCSSLSNSDALNSANEVATDERSWLLFQINSMSVRESNAYIYPRLLPLFRPNAEEQPASQEGEHPPQQSDEFPKALRCSLERLSPQGVYLAENGITLFLWFGSQVSQQWVAKVFGVGNLTQADVSRMGLLEQATPESGYVFSIIDRVKSQRSRSMPVIIVKQGDRSEAIFKRLMVEDRGETNSPSYVDYLCHIHKEVRSILSR